MSRSCKAVSALFALVTSTMTAGAQAADADKLVGTWRLVSRVYEEVESKAVHKPFGDNPSGITIFSSDGWECQLITASDRKPPAALEPTDAEAAQLFRTMAASCFRYKIDGDKWSVTTEVSNNPSFVGREATGVAEWKGPDRYQSKSSPFASNLVGGKQVVLISVWERVK
jgi:hypothetical protein